MTKPLLRGSMPVVGRDHRCIGQLRDGRCISCWRIECERLRKQLRAYETRPLTAERDRYREALERIDRCIGAGRASSATDLRVLAQYVTRVLGRDGFNV